MNGQKRLIGGCTACYGVSSFENLPEARIELEIFIFQLYFFVINLIRPFFYKDVLR